jgi:hypothetical protein
MSACVQQMYNIFHPESLARGRLKAAAANIWREAALGKTATATATAIARKGQKRKKNSKYIHVSRQITIGMMYRSVMTARLVFRQSISH